MLAVLPFAACGAQEDPTSPHQLKAFLFPAAGFAVEVEREFEWSNPTDFAVQGLRLPEATNPSEAVRTIDEAGFEVGAGRVFAPSSGAPQAYASVVKFESDAGARAILEYLHDQDTRSPCLGVCPVRPRSLALDRVPGAQGAHHEPIEDGSVPEAAGEPLERYMVEFTVGPYLFVGDVRAGPGILPREPVMRGMKAFRDYAVARAD